VARESREVLLLRLGEPITNMPTTTAPLNPDEFVPSIHIGDTRPGRRRMVQWMLRLRDWTAGPRTNEASRSGGHKR